MWDLIFSDVGHDSLLHPHRWQDAEKDKQDKEPGPAFGAGMCV